MSAPDIPASLRYALGDVGSESTGRAAPPQLATLDRHGRVVMVVGPGVLADDAVEGLRRFAAAAHVGVLNTWGAKGVFNWDSAHHIGTFGLQRDDIALCGLDDADLVITSGLDADECSPEALGAVPQLDLAPADLAGFADVVTPCPGAIEPTELYRRIAEIAGPGYERVGTPVHPAAAIVDVTRRFADAIVIAEPGTAGFWVARMFPTPRPGVVVVPARGGRGIAYELATLATARGHRCVVVDVDGAPGGVDGSSFPIVSWEQDMDHAVTDALVAVAGPVIGLNGARMTEESTRG